MSAPTERESAIFLRDGDRLVPTPLAQGPWNPEHQHGGAVSAALAWAIERCETPVPMRPVRLTFDLMHPAPLRPMRTDVQVVRSGKRIQLVDAVLLEGERPVARANALLMRFEPGLLSGEERLAPQAPPLASSPEEGRQLASTIRHRRAGQHMPGFIRAVDFLRLREPVMGELCVGWTRMKVPVVEGEETSPFVQLAALADFVSGLANGLDFTRHVAINPDIALQIERLPESDWLGIESRTHVSVDGIGTSAGTFYDLTGPVAHASASIYVAPR